MAVYKRGRVWWYKFTWKGEPFRERTKQTNKRVAEQIEAAHKTSLAKREVGIRDRTPAATIRQFAKNDFIPYCRPTFAAKPNTLSYYENGAARLLEFSAIADESLDTIASDKIAAYALPRQDAGLKIATVNRELQVLRRMFTLAMEWGKVERALPRVRMIPGEARRDQVISVDEEKVYLDATQAIGTAALEAYQRALVGIRAAMRGEQPIQPKDPYRMRDVATLLIDCGLRPEECFRLRWENIRDDALHILFGKTASARRVIPLTPRAVRTRPNAAHNRAVRGVALSRSNQERTYRKIDAEEATPECVQAGKTGVVSALHVPPYLPDALGGVHGRLYAGLPGWPQRLLHHAAIRSPAGANGSGGDGARAERTEWAQFWAH